MHVRLLVAGVFSLWFGAVGCTAEPLPADATRRADDAIVNGQLDLADPAVVALTIQGQAFCSATLITPSIVLTAAHCLPPHTGFPVSQIEVLFGTGPTIDALIPVNDAWSHPAWNEQNLADDVGLLQMTANGPATPIPLNTNAVPNGTDVRLVGFGITSVGANDSGIKREGVGRVGAQDAFVLDIERNPGVTCSGDSGGPTFVATGNGEAVAGIHSRSDCSFGSLDTRVDAYLGDIQAFLDSHPEPSCEADGFCAAPCDSGVDPDCPCADDGQCVAACPTPSDDPDCEDACGPDGMCIENCGFPDPDCPSCGPDGECVPGCGPPDPDCADPTCDPATECCDDNCGEDEVDEPFVVDDGGCGCTVPGDPRDSRSPIAWLCAAVVLARLRRRNT